MLTVTVLRAGAALLTSAALWFASAAGGAEETKQPAQEEQKKDGAEKKAEKSEPEVQEFRLTVMVSAGDPASAVNRANVRVFYGTDSQEFSTGTDGRATFRFSTVAKMATVRVRADTFNPYQSTFSLTAVETEHRAVLTKSN